MWDQIKTIYGNDSMYSWSWYAFNANEWDMRDVDQTKKNSFKRMSKGNKESIDEVPVVYSRMEEEVDPPSEEVKLDVPSWGEFTQTTTFHGVKYIFNKTPSKLRR